MVDRNTGKRRGFGFIVYETSEAAERALSTKEHRLCGKEVLCFCLQLPKWLKVEVKRAQPKAAPPSDTYNPSQYPPQQSYPSYSPPQTYVPQVPPYSQQFQYTPESTSSQPTSSQLDGRYQYQQQQSVGSPYSQANNPSTTSPFSSENPSQRPEQSPYYSGPPESETQDQYQEAKNLPPRPPQFQSGVSQPYNRQYVTQPEQQSTPPPQLYKSQPTPTTTTTNTSTQFPLVPPRQYLPQTKGTDPQSRTPSNFQPGIPPSFQSPINNNNNPQDRLSGPISTFQQQQIPPPPLPSESPSPLTSPIPGGSMYQVPPATGNRYSPYQSGGGPRQVNPRQFSTPLSTNQQPGGSTDSNWH
ncbi:hypothetical protein Pelo_7502 [Pelomyxa schiedti]|nr:hypothetical protein Pelo_7502 [Pelomyxa schiedti]